MKKFFIFCLLSVMTLISCGINTRDVENSTASGKEIRDIGNGLFLYESGPGAKWVRSLKEFKASHPDLVITTIGTVDEGAYGLTRSIVIVTYPKSYFK